MKNYKDAKYIAKKKHQSRLFKQMNCNLAKHKIKCLSYQNIIRFVATKDVSKKVQKGASHREVSRR